MIILKKKTLLHVGLIICGIASISIAGIVGLAMKKFATKKNLVLKVDMAKNKSKGEQGEQCLV